MVLEPAPPTGRFRTTLRTVRRDLMQVRKRPTFGVRGPQTSDQLASISLWSELRRIVSLFQNKHRVNEEWKKRRPGSSVLRLSETTKTKEETCDPG
jgi:hypothetical protein